jgi:hypothetical protein
MQEQLIRVLAHRMIDIADRLGLLRDNVSKALLIESAQRKWQLPAAFAWTVEYVQISRLRDEKSFKRALTPTRRTQVMEPRRLHSCLRCFTGIQPVCQPCMRHALGHTVRGLPSLQASIVSPEQPRVRDTLSSNTLSPLFCRKCGFILPEDMKDRLCSVCTLDIGYFDQNPDWQRQSNSSYPTENSSFNGPPVPTCDVSFYGDASSSLSNSIPVTPNSGISGFVVDYVEEVNSGVVHPALESPPLFDDFGQNGGLPMCQNVPVCGLLADHAHDIEPPPGYLV